MAKSQSDQLRELRGMPMNQLMEQTLPRRGHLNYWEQQWVRCSRLLLGVSAPRFTRRGGMRKHRRAAAACAATSSMTLRFALVMYGLPRGGVLDDEIVDPSAQEILKIDKIEEYLFLEPLFEDSQRMKVSPPSGDE